ncbi:YitT family protein [Jutongia hominis]|uniref:YitT family protein n=1 Tax=Jutongia hominis TaxID=2763664 RepID=UPI002ECB97A5|nr:YitT family protein [Lachnospiraceae bacterium]
MLEILKGLRWKNILLLTIAGCINAFGVTIFLAPVELYDSGISGTSMLLSQITPSYLSLSVFLVVLNIPLFLYGLKKQGIYFTIYATYTVIIYSFMAWLITDVLPIDVSLASPLAGKDLLLCALFGGLVSGIGSGLAIRFDGAMDGIEVMAVIFAKRLGVSVGTFVMTYNVLLYIICGIVIHSWILPLYSIVTYMAALKTVDFIVDGFDHAKCAMIITTKADEICDALSLEFESGLTKINAVGGYSGIERTVIYFVVNRFQITKMREIISEIDPSAFIALHDITDVFSENQ